MRRLVILGVLALVIGVVIMFPPRRACNWAA